MKTAAGKKTVTAKKVGATASSGAAAAGLGAAGVAAPGGATVPVGAQAAYQQHLPTAQALAASDVVVCRGNAGLIYKNLMTGVNHVLAQKAAATAALTNPQLEAIAGLESLGQAFLFADNAAATAQHSGTRNLALQESLAQAKSLRATLMSSAEALVTVNVFSAAAVAGIKKGGTGSIHTADELLALATLFGDNAAAVAGKSPVTPAMVAQAAALGTTLKTQLTPKGAPKQGSTPAATASDLRDRFYTLLVQGYPQLWRVGAVLAGPDAIAATVPPLLSHGGRGTVAKAAAKAAKVATKATAKATKAAARAASVKPKPVKKPKKPRG